VTVTPARCLGCAAPHLSRATPGHRGPRTTAVAPFTTPGRRPRGAALLACGQSQPPQHVTSRPTRHTLETSARPCVLVQLLFYASLNCLRPLRAWHVVHPLHAAANALMAQPRPGFDCVMHVGPFLQGQMTKIARAHLEPARCSTRGCGVCPSARRRPAMLRCCHVQQERVHACA
jgi:hypothetical protein